MLAEAITPDAEENNASQDLSLVVAQPVTSSKKAEASRRNGKLSKGPVTLQGKNTSRLNAVRHGLRTTIPMFRQPGLPQQRDFDGLVEQLREEFNPQTQLADETVRQLALELMKSRLIQEMELAMFRTCFDKGPEALSAYSTRLTLLLPADQVEQILAKNTSELQSEIESLTELSKGLNTGNIPAFAPDCIDRVAKGLWIRISGYTQCVRNSQEELKQIEVQLTSNIPRKERRELIRELKEKKRMLAVYIEAERDGGPAACGVGSVDDIAAALSGQRDLNDDQIHAWLEILSGYTERLKGELEIHQKKEQLIANARQEAVRKLVEQTPTVNLLGRYSAGTNRNIDRLLKILKNHGGDKPTTIDIGGVGSFGQT
jgi:hypothetical protein